MSVIVCTEVVRDKIREWVPVEKKEDGWLERLGIEVKGEGRQEMAPVNPALLGMMVLTLPESAFEGCKDRETDEPANLLNLSNSQLKLLLPHWENLRDGKMKLCDVLVPKGVQESILAKRMEW